MNATTQLTQLWRAERVTQQRGLCAICRRAMRFGDVTLDHKTPLAKGGKHEFENTQAVHRLCNLDKDRAPKALWRRTRHDYEPFSPPRLG